MKRAIHPVVTLLLTAGIFALILRRVPFPALGLDWLANRCLAPLLGWFCLTVFIVARPARPPLGRPPTVSVVIPARNEAGNIAAATL